MSRLMQQRKDLMRNGIYEAAVAVLVEHGFEAMTMDRVADEAGVAKGSLYNYFPNKVELLQFVHDKTIEPLRERVDAILEADRSAIDKLRAIFRTWFQYISEHRGLFHFLFNEYAVHVLLKREGGTSQDDGIRNLRTVIEQGIEERVFRPVDSQRCATMLFGAVCEACERQVASDEPFLVDEMLEFAMEFFLHGVGQATAKYQ